ncbi:hypothetical protein D3C76_782730 [compost metagenome]
MRRQIGKDTHPLLDMRLQISPVQVIQGLYRECDRMGNAVVAKAGDGICEDVCTPND